MLRSRVILIATAASAVVLLLAGIVVWQLVWPRTVSISAEGAEIRFPAGAFEADARPAMSTAPTDDEFLSVFGLTTGGSGPVVASVGGPAEPGEPLEIVLDADVGDLPARCLPCSPGMPMPACGCRSRPRWTTTAGSSARPTGWASSPPRCSPLVPTVGSARWLSFQVAGDRAHRPRCTAAPRPWLLDVAVDAETAAPLSVCADAYAEYALGDHRQFTGLLGAREYMPPDVVVEVRLLVDGDPVAEYEIGQEAVQVDLAMPPGEMLRIEAERTAGVCGPAPDAYLVFGNAALF